MKKVRIYTTTYCPYCTRAKELLTRKNISFEEIDITQDPMMREKLIELTNGRTTVPQIFIGDLSVGGFDELSTLDKTEKLEGLLKE